MNGAVRSSIHKNLSIREGAFDDKRISSEKLASFSGEARETSFSELFQRTQIAVLGQVE